MSNFDFDVAVIGGGPGGSAAASMLSRLGHHALVLEREHFPRFHIGESQVPWLNEVLAEIGATDAVEAARFVEKWGASFSTPDGLVEQYADFTQAFEVPAPRIFQVPRAEFDRILLAHAAACGADVRQGVAVTDLDFDADGVTVTCTSDAAGEQRMRVRAIIDASGRAGFLAKRFGERRKDPVLRNIAVHRQYEGIPRPSGRRAGDIRMVTRDDRGWFWFIPISETVTSVGAVVPQSVYNANARATPDETLAHFLAETPAAARLAASATPVTSACFDADYSYLHSCHAGDRFAIVGDAGAFLDPIFSTGVLLAMQSGIEAARAMSDGIRKGDLRAACFAAYEKRLVNRYHHFRRFAIGFYDDSFRDLFFSRSSRFGVYQSVLSVLGGNWKPSRRTRAGIALFFALVRLQRFVPLAPRLATSVRPARDAH